MSTYNTTSRHLDVSPSTGVQVSRVVEIPTGIKWQKGKVSMKKCHVFDIVLGLINDRLFVQPGSKRYCATEYEQLFLVCPGDSVPGNSIVEITNWNLEQH